MPPLPQPKLQSRAGAALAAEELEWKRVKRMWNYTWTRNGWYGSGWKANDGRNGGWRGNDGRTEGWHNDHWKRWKGGWDKSDWKTRPSDKSDWKTRPSDEGFWVM